jgi:hypothetical protein
MDHSEQDKTGASAQHNHQTKLGFLPVSFSSRTVLDPRHSLPDDNALCALHLSEACIMLLWKSFLKNVHVLVKLFFDWEIEPIIQRVPKHSSTLSRDEKALVSSITFVSILSLTEEECMGSLGGEKPKLLDTFQRGVEDALLLADYTTTTNMRTLQALALYLVHLSFIW